MSYNHIADAAQDSDLRRRVAACFAQQTTGTEQPEYVPDFVVEMDAFILLAETKKRDDLKSDEVVAKAAAALRWCKYASDRARNVGGKPWKYILVPHDEIAESKRLADFLRFEVKD